MQSRAVKEGRQPQGEDEIVPYTLTTTPWGSAPASVSVKAKDLADDSDVTATVFPVNSPVVSGDVITLSPLKLLTRGHLYRVEVKFVIGTATYEAFFEIQAEE
jgi:hypothetical protein